MIRIEVWNLYRVNMLTGFIVAFIFISGRQIGVFSSTWEPEIEQLVKDLVSETDLVKVPKFLHSPATSLLMRSIFFKNLCGYVVSLTQVVLLALLTD